MGLACFLEARRVNRSAAEIPGRVMISSSLGRASAVAKSNFSVRLTALPLSRYAVSFLSVRFNGLCRQVPIILIIFWGSIFNAAGCEAEREKDSRDKYEAHYLASTLLRLDQTIIAARLIRPLMFPVLIIFHIVAQSDLFLLIQ